MNRIIRILFIIQGISMFFWGCDGIVNPNYNVTPHWFTGSGDLPDGIELTLEAPDEIRLGEPAPLKLTIKNTTEWDMRLRFREHRTNFMVADAATDELVWSLHMINPVILANKSPLIVLKSGEEMTWEAEWDQTYGEFKDKYEPGSRDHLRDKDLVGDQVSSGTYRLYGSLFIGVKNHNNEQDYHSTPHYITILD